MSGKKVKRTQFGQKLKLADIFGKPVFLTHKGNEKFKTPLGAVASICFGIFILGYSLTQMVKVWDHSLK